MLLEEKGAQIAELEERVARLERCGCGRKPGKQPGSPRAYLAWNDRPDKEGGYVPRGGVLVWEGRAQGG